MMQWPKPSGWSGPWPTSVSSCREHLDSALDAEAAAVSEVESLRSQLAERQCVVAAFEARVRALEASQHECRAAELRERELRVKAEVEGASSDADCHAAVARAESAEAQAERWRSVSEQATANAELRRAPLPRTYPGHPFALRAPHATGGISRAT